MGKKLARILIHMVIRLFIRLDIKGYENLPREGAVIVTSNHLGRMDAVLVFYILDRTDVTLLAAEKYQKNPFYRWFAKQFDAIFIDRFNADMAALRATLNRVRRGDVVVMAPEGTRSPTGALIEGRAGASYLAARAGVPVLPVAIWGSEDSRVVAELRRFRRPTLHVRAGECFSLPPIQGKDREVVLSQYTDEIMCRIAALLPPSYHGVYAGHPRLQELLADTVETQV